MNIGLMQVVASICLAIGTLFLGAGTASADDVIRVVFRMDDYSQVSEWDKERRIIEIFRDRQIPITVAVVPFEEGKVLAGERASYLRAATDAGVVELALHGRTHENLATDGLSTEFRDVSLQKQRAAISGGLQHLEQTMGRGVRVFVPPWNQYDGHTEEVLEELGFEVLSASYAGPVRLESALKYIPFTALLHETRLAVEIARRQLEDGIEPVVVVLTHDFEFTASDPVQGSLYGAPRSYTFDELAELLDWLAAQPDVKVTTFADYADSGAALDGESFGPMVTQHERYVERHTPLTQARLRLTPPPLARPLRDPIGYSLVYPLGGTESLGMWERLVVLMPTVAYYLVVILTSALVGFFLAGLLRPHLRARRLALLCSVAALLAVIALMIVSPRMGYKISALAVACIAVVGGFLARRPPPPSLAQA